jgi:hypothetical protein
MHCFARFVFAFACSISLPFGPALAQPATPSAMTAERAAKLPPPSSRRATTAEAMNVMDEFGRCLVRGKAKLAALAVSKIIDYEAIARAATLPEASTCLASEAPGFDSRLRFNNELLRGSVFKALYRQKHGLQQPTFSGMRADWSATTAAMTADVAERFRIFHQIAECALAADPQEVHRLITADYGSQPHQAAFTQLAPAMGNCLPEGMELKLPRPSMAGALAEVAYLQSLSTAP